MGDPERNAPERPASAGQARGAGRVALIRYRLRVRFADCDPLGHVNNATYLTYLEQARIVLWGRQLGFTSRRMAAGEAGRVGFILARAEIDFRAEVHDGDELEVRLALAGFGRSTAMYEYEVVDLTDRTVVAAAKTVQVWYDYDARKSVPISEELKVRLSRPVEDVSE